MCGPDPVEWRVDAGSSRLLRAIVYIEAGLFGGGVLLVFCGMVFFGVTTALDGQYTYLGYIPLLALIGGPLSLLYLWPMIVDDAQRPPLGAAFASEGMAERYAASFTRGRLLAVVLGGALVLHLSLFLDARLTFALAVGSLLLLPVASGVISWGWVEPDEATMTYRDRSIALSRVERIRRIDLGGVALCWLSYHPGGDDLTSPRLVVLSRQAANAVERIMADVDPEIDEEYAPDRAVQAALGFLALCFLGLAALVLVSESGDAGDPLLQWYIGIGFGFFGGMLAVAAFFSG